MSKQPSRTQQNIDYLLEQQKAGNLEVMIIQLPFPELVNRCRSGRNTPVLEIVPPRVLLREPTE